LQEITGCGEFVILPPTDDGSSVSVLDFGAKPNTEHCNYTAFYDAIQHCRANGINKLIVPKGVYKFSNADFVGDFQLHFKDMSNFIFDGDGSELIFSVEKPFIGIENCKQILFKNLIIDWDWSNKPLASIAKVLKVDESGEYFDFIFPTLDSVDENIKIQIIGPLDPLTLKPGCKNGVEFRPYKNKFVELTDNEEENVKLEGLVRELSNIIKSVKKLKSNQLRIYTNFPDWCLRYINVGQVYNIRHFEYDANCITFSGSHLTFENITIYSTIGHGYYGSGDLHHFQLQGCKITKRPGTVRSLSSTVDGIHLGNTRGYFKIENCEFSYMGDDCINFHDNSSRGISILDENTLFSKQGGTFSVGDVIEIRNPDLSPTGFASKLTKVTYLNGKKCNLVFADKLPEKISENSILFNLRYNTSNYIIRNNTFHSNRARGMLVQGSDGLIEGNSFYKIQGAAIQIETGCESRWSEGYGVKNVIFRNNIIDSCDVNSWVMAVVYMGVYLPEGRTQYSIFKNILFENNTIIACPRMAFFLSSCSKVVLRENVIINPNTMQNHGNVFGSSQRELPVYGESYHGTIMMLNARNIELSDNTRLETVDTLEREIYYTSSCSNIIDNGNVGFKSIGKMSSP
jgi:parallel beta-helix repeat protein